MTPGAMWYAGDDLTCVVPQLLLVGFRARCCQEVG